jgi:hypothetical protein
MALTINSLTVCILIIFNLTSYSQTLDACPSRILTAGGTGGYSNYNWYDSNPSTSGTLLGTGNTFDASIYEGGSIWIEGTRPSVEWLYTTNFDVTTATTLETVDIYIKSFDGMSTANSSISISIYDITLGSSRV